MPLFALVVIWVAAVVVVDPIADFPLNDDWSYGTAVRHLLEHGELRFSDWTTMTLVSQVLWGALFCLPFGFSFTALRFSTLSLAQLAIVSFYVLLRQLGSSRAVAFAATLTVLANPLVIHLAHSFMTDMPFAALSILAMLLLLPGIERSSPWRLGGGLAVALVATFVRQLGLFLFIGFAAAWLATRRLGVRTIAVAGLPALGALVLLRAFETWLASRDALPALYHAGSETLRANFAAGVGSALADGVVRGLEAGVYLGLFVAPLVPLWMAHALREGRKAQVAAMVVTTALVTSALALADRLLPFFSNTFLAIGCGELRLAHGPLTLHGGCTAWDPGLGGLATPLRVLLTALGVLGLCSLLVASAGAAWRSLRGTAEERARPHSLFLVVAAASYLAPLALTHLFDRYLLALCPLAVALLALSLPRRPPPRAAVALSAVLLTTGLTFGVGATEEYLNWNRARWRALDYLAEAGAGWREIDGGFEFNGWYGFSTTWEPTPGKTWWVVDNRYRISFGPSNGYRVLARFPFRAWLGFKEGEVLALEERDRGSSLSPRSSHRRQRSPREASD